MSETVRNVGLAMATIASLLIVAMGLGALVETDDPDWELLVIGFVAFVSTVLPLLFRRNRTPARAPRREP